MYIVIYKIYMSFLFIVDFAFGTFLYVLLVQCYSSYLPLSLSSHETI